MGRQGTETERLETLDHVMNCDACQADFDLMQAIAAGRPVPARRFPVPMVAAAAVALLISGSILFLAVTGRTRQDGLRGGLTVIELVSPRGAAGSRPVTFIWRSGPMSARYSLEVLDAAGDPVYSAELADTAAILPDAISLIPGERYHWWVLVRTPDGRQVRSEAVQFRP